MSSKYSEYLNLYLYLQIWKSTCTWLKYFEKYLTPTLQSTLKKGVAGGAPHFQILDAALQLVHVVRNQAASIGSDNDLLPNRR